MANQWSVAVSLSHKQQTAVWTLLLHLLLLYWTAQDVQRKMSQQDMPILVLMLLLLLLFLLLMPVLLLLLLLLLLLMLWKFHSENHIHPLYRRTAQSFLQPYTEILSCEHHPDTLTRPNILTFELKYIEIEFWDLFTVCYNVLYWMLQCCLTISWPDHVFKYFGHC